MKYVQFIIYFFSFFRYGINALLTVNGHFYVPTEPYLTKKYLLVCGGLILSVQRLPVFIVSTITFTSQQVRELSYIWQFEKLSQNKKKSGLP